MSAKIYQRILQVGLFASLGVIFLLFANLLFPYISSKQLSFNIMMELLLPFWLILVWKYPSFRPQKSAMTWGLVAYFTAILISCFTGVDFNLSFWGDVERLLGFFQIFHFFLFYIFLITAFRNREDWYWLLSASVLVAAIEALMIVRGEAIGTIGNTAYVSGYMLFNLYFSALLLLRTPWKRQWPFYIAILVMLLAFFKANTSGAIIGLGTSLLLLLFLLGLFAARKMVRRTSLISFAIALVAVIALFSQYNQPWFQNNKRLHNLSIYKSTFQTRLLSWQGAARDFSSHPWLGTGFGNYATIFDRQFDSAFFNYSTSETYFDRAHNNLIDIASTTGVVGLVSYLSIFAAALWAWFRSIKKHHFRILPGAEGLAMRELLVIAALLAAYFIQNLAVFDSLATYMGLMLALAYLVYLTQKEEKTEELEVESTAAIKPVAEFTGLAITGILVIIVIFAYNVRPWRMLTKTIEAYAYTSSGQVASGFLSYKQAFAYNTPLDRDARNTLVNMVIGNPTMFTRLSMGDIQVNLAYTIETLEKNVAYNENDSLMQMQAAQIYDIASRYYYQQPAMFKTYSDKAIDAAEKSVAASPGRAPVYFVLAQIQANRGDYQGAEKSFLTAYNLNPNYVDSHCQLANYYFLVKDSRYQGFVDSCLDKGGKTVMPDVLASSTEYYLKNKDNGKLLLAYRLMAEKGSIDAILYVNLAKAELAAGNVEAALNAAVKAADIDESLRPAVQAFLKGLQASTTATSTATSTQ